MLTANGGKLLVSSKPQTPKYVGLIILCTPHRNAFSARVVKYAISQLIRRRLCDLSVFAHYTGYAEGCLNWKYHRVTVVKALTRVHPLKD